MDRLIRNLLFLSNRGKRMAVSAQQRAPAKALANQGSEEGTDRHWWIRCGMVEQSSGCGVAVTGDMGD
jgi:hypothetical protein